MERFAFQYFEKNKWKICKYKKWCEKKSENFGKKSLVKNRPNTQGNKAGSHNERGGCWIPIELNSIERTYYRAWPTVSVFSTKVTRYRAGPVQKADKGS